MIGRFLLSALLLAGVAGSALAQAPVQLYPRGGAAAVPAPAPEPAAPVPPPAPPVTAPAPVTPPPATPPPVVAPQPMPAPAPVAPRGIAVTPLPPAAMPPPAPVPPPSAAPVSPRDEVLAVVEGFYNALSRGDGAQANAFLVPEKRNQGPFEIAGMTRFYSAMREPLRVVGVGRLDPDIVRVQYAYVHQSGRRCDGVADVVVHRVGGRPLIERIRALSGC